MSIRRIAAPAGSSVNGSPASLRALGIGASAPALDLSAATSTPPAASSASVVPLVASKRNHSHKPSREPRDNMFAMNTEHDAASSSAAASSTAAAAASPGSGLDSKRTVRKKVSTLGLQPQQPLSPSEAGIASLKAGIASVSEHTGGVGTCTGSLRASPRPKIASSSPAVASISERMRVRGSALAPLANHNLGTPGASPHLAPMGKSSPRGGGAAVGDLAEGGASQPASPLFATPTERDRETSKLHLSRSAADGGGGSDEEDSEFSRRFARGGAGGVTPAVRGAKLDADGTGLDPAYYDLVRLNPLFWTDPDFASNTDQIWAHYTTHLRAAFSHKERRDQHMDGASLTRLANDTVERFLERHRSLLAKTNPRFGPREVQAAVIKDLPHTAMAMGASFASLKSKRPKLKKSSSSSSSAATADESSQAQPFEGAALISELKTHVSHRLRKELDKDRDGKIRCVHSASRGVAMQRSAGEPCAASAITTRGCSRVCAVWFSCICDLCLLPSSSVPPSLVLVLAPVTLIS